MRVSTGPNPHTDFEQFFAVKFHLDQCLEDLRSVCLSGNDARMRDACCALIQVYIAYHPRPHLPWLGLTEDRYQAVVVMLRLEFRRLGELIEYEQVDSSTIREKSRRSARLVVIDALQKVAAALEDVAPFYRSSLSPKELIDEARFQYRLVVVTKPRMAFFDGDQLSVDWNKKSKPWELLRYLAAKGEQLKCVDQYDPSGNPSPSAMSTTKGRLCQYLMDSEPTPNSPASQLACCIETTKEGEYYLNLAPH